MSENICGAETTGDKPCQNPAGDNGRCWIPSHNPDSDDENPHGRDFAIDEADYDDILEAARDGLSKAGCARAVGVDEKSLQRYVETHPDFRRAFRRARGQGEQSLIDGGLHDDGTDTSMAKFLLASSFDYKKTEQTEVTGEDGGPVQTRTEVVIGGSDES